VLIMAGIVLKRVIKGLWHYHKASPGPAGLSSGGVTETSARDHHVATPLVIIIIIIIITRHAQLKPLH
jgi:hypothetical protein